MRGKVVFAFLLIMAASFQATLAARRMTAWNFIRCFTLCRKSYTDKICAYSDGSFMIFGRKTYDCLQRNCGRGGQYLHDGPCNTQSAQVLERSRLPASNNNVALVAKAA